ncbi:hypothetical protein F5146DRAFT_182117 [Armillaria mellea]|nr:hypothetical protein F5146DRAFT_182117 [Armillaria mellea]
MASSLHLTLSIYLHLLQTTILLRCVLTFDLVPDPSQHLDRLLELTGDYAPPAINSWFHANVVKVTRFSAKSLPCKHLPSDASYFFPDPHLFLDLYDRERMAYLHMWKEISAFWKYRASCNKLGAHPLSSEEWR